MPALLPLRSLTSAAVSASSTPMDPLEVLSAVVGWTYFVAWSASFYPQVILNYRRKYVGGLSIDFTILNLLGHSSYAIYNLSLYANPTVREQYRERHNGKENTVQLNDVAFSVHASILTLVTFAQTLYYPRAASQRLSLWNRVIVSFVGIVLAANVYGVAILKTEQILDIIQVLSVFKLYVSVAKYIPQAYENYSNKSTAGWSIENVLLDFSGGVLSFTQLFLDAARTSNWGSITGNPVKFGLSVLSALFSLVFITQHYILYGANEKADLEYLGKSESRETPERVRREPSRGVSGEREPLLG